MKYFFIICLQFFLFINVSFSQEKTITHKVEADETIVEIAKKYQVTPYDIYQLNPDAQKRLKPNMVLLIPSKAGAKVTAVAPKLTLPTGSHEVMPKETIYGIQKQYGITEEALKKANPFLETDGLQIGQVLVIPYNRLNKSEAPVVTEKSVYHEVLPKETKYSIAKQYGITIEELEKLNPEIVPNLTIGYKLLINGAPTPAKVIKTVEPLEVKKVVLNPLANDLKKEVTYTTYEVKPQETLYSLSKMFDLSQDELIKLNPALINGVTIGMVLKVPSKTALQNQVKKEFTSLSNIIAEGKRKRLVMLLPFNIPNVQGDTVNSTTERLKKDKFLNMTMDFYAGALMAIDSAKVLGLPIDIEIYDSQENKYGSNVPALIQKHQLQSANAIIGPFYQSNAEVAAKLLKETNTPVISPLSKDVGNPYRNLYQTIPSTETVKNTMFDFMRSNGGNIMAVVDRKKESIIKYIKENQKGVPFVAFTSNGSVSVESFKSLLVKGKMNYVVMETANTWMIKTTLAMMLGVMNDYQVQLVILEPNDTLDFEEIKFENLVKLKLMYPSVTRENISNEAVMFEKNYKKVNTIYPGTYATRGFDVTFDTMMRLVQDVKFEETVNTVATKQVDNQFEYYLKSDGGYTNKGVFILYYDSDLTIKEAK
ncbi:LysM peptidoglycan-binding domain-containing protein [Flavobacterium sp. NG2]|uniref:LysM peptidoglycan-binding domain-containing protein n=1 Tax=Flavobacterium sp. NG2 TaxID=3097547 RepID=UPI002A7F65C5|nr:LysM peptidoglycan-binding domain-containing protein [Flavobacterium sp. NG2]WPR70412.1 LysM peptidoglycan-binding domain-containing protein [Flavobacterium sp. NG2]